MGEIIIPIALLFIIALVNTIPFLRNIRVALLVAPLTFILGLSAMENTKCIC